MRRREFIRALGGLAFVPPAIAQTARLPLVGFLNAASTDTYRFNADSFRKGLRQAGFIEGVLDEFPDQPALAVLLGLLAQAGRIDFKLSLAHDASPLLRSEVVYSTSVDVGVDAVDIRADVVLDERAA